MTHRKRVGALAIFAVLTLLLTSLISSPVQAKPRKGGGKDKVNYGTTSWVSGAGQGYSIKGKVKARKKRKVLLQVKLADGWHTIDRARTKKKGKFKIKGQLDWYGNHKVRVLAPKTRRDRAKVFKTKKLKVATSWVPRGEKSSFARMSYRGVNFAWNPCRTVKYRINTGVLGDAVIPFTQHAVELLERATGFKTKYAGTTTDVPLSNQPYTKGTDLVIAWSHQDQYPDLVQAVGMGGPGNLKPARRRSNNKVVLEIKRPGVTMNLAYAGVYPFTYDDPATEPMGLVLVHELGHAFGLDHFADDIQIMHPGNRSPSPTGYHSTFEAGDLQGLKLQGAKPGCLKPYRNRRFESEFSSIPDFTME